ncbi:hypothetical protein SDC9_97359 [bioreactor metagenome]|uniref:Uncharacterized protein n=1 Tax=bioreactor metagenome TaxID=1076179 RepID=A0A645AC58_9ZZZZ
MVGRHQLDLLAQHLAAEIVDGHLHRRHGAGAGDVGERAGQVREHAYAHHVVGYLRILRVGERGCRDQCAGAGQLTWNGE